MRISLRRPTAGHVGVALASLALFVSLGGVSEAARVINGKFLKKGSVTSTKIKNGAVTGGKIKNSSITGAKIKDGAVTKADLAASAVLPDAGSVGPDAIANGAVTNPKLAENSVGTNKIIDGAVNNQDLAPGSVGRNKIVTDAVGYDALGLNSVRGYQANSSGEETLNFGSVAAGGCASLTISDVGPADGTVANDAITVTPGTNFDTTGVFTFRAQPASATSIKVTVCNTGGTPLDPDGANGVTYRFITFGGL